MHDGWRGNRGNVISIATRIIASTIRTTWRAAIDGFKGLSMRASMESILLLTRFVKESTQRRGTRAITSPVYAARNAAVKGDVYGVCISVHIAIKAMVETAR